MKNTWYIKLSLNIAAVFIVVIALSYIPAEYPKLFGDWLCEGRIYKSDYTDGHTIIKGIEKGCDYTCGNITNHNPTWHWGYQHWLWFLMGLCLFVVQAFRVGEIINNKNK